MRGGRPLCRLRVPFLFCSDPNKSSHAWKSPESVQAENIAGQKIGSCVKGSNVSPEVSTNDIDLSTSWVTTMTLLLGLDTSQPSLLSIRSHRTPADEQRAEEIFLSVWRRIDAKDRQQIATDWLARYNSWFPRFELEDPWYGDKIADASCSVGGLQVQFNWRRIHLLPDFVLEAILAHEMAHVFQHATKKDRYSLVDADLRGTVVDLDGLVYSETGRVELHADEIMLSWGFNVLDIFVWKIRHTKEEHGVLTIREQPLNEKRCLRKAKKMQLNTYLT